MVSPPWRRSSRERTDPPIPWEVEAAPYGSLAVSARHDGVTIDSRELQTRIMRRIRVYLDDEDLARLET
jgi:hypothetical protein